MHSILSCGKLRLHSGVQGVQTINELGHLVPCCDGFLHVALDAIYNLAPLHQHKRLTSYITPCSCIAETWMQEGPLYFNQGPCPCQFPKNSHPKQRGRKHRGLQPGGLPRSRSQLLGHGWSHACFPFRTSLGYPMFRHQPSIPSHLHRTCCASVGRGDM